MRYQRKLPDVLSVEEAARLLEAAPGIKYKAALGVAYGAGLRVSEVAHLKVDDTHARPWCSAGRQGPVRLRAEATRLCGGFTERSVRVHHVA
ncbi:hypothetical protein X738_29985 [Mesorhizobium sp. LNHC209A00]|nr:tyrosine-type recombinase/integrase [Mesorhizobium sp. LNHC209A00]ESY90705.1 hypothetical protein X738_29985 [Mesorhizobium sp. LNHC209A00]